MASTVIRTTLALPRDLLAATDKLVQAGEARSRNELIARALRHELAQIERATVDAAFREMAEDTEYQRETRQLLVEFASADRETWPDARTSRRRRRR